MTLHLHQPLLLEVDHQDLLKFSKFGLHHLFLVTRNVAVIRLYLVNTSKLMLGMILSVWKPERESPDLLLMLGCAWYAINLYLVEEAGKQTDQDTFICSMNVQSTHIAGVTGNK